MTACHDLEKWIVCLLVNLAHAGTVYYCSTEHLLFVELPKILIYFYMMILNTCHNFIAHFLLY